MAPSIVPTDGVAEIGRATTKPQLALISGPDIASRISLAKLLAADFGVTIIGSKATATDSMGGLPYREYHLARSVSPIGDIRTLTQLTTVLRTLKPQIVQTFSTKPSVLGRLAARQARVPVIVGTVPGMGSIYGDERVRTRLLRFTYERLQKVACQGSTTVFQNQDDLDEYIRRRLVRREAATVIPGSGVDTDAFRPDSLTAEASAELKLSLGIEPSAVVVTMVTRIIRSKGVGDFGEAARLLRGGSTQYHFLLVGELDVESREALDKAEWDSLQRSVHCLGTRTDVAALLGITDVFALPSYYREGVPRALLEAAASGKALITTDLPGCRDVVQHDSTGLIVPPRNSKRLAEAIASLVSNPSRRVRLGRSARQLAVSRFDLRVVAATMRRLYLELLDRQSGVVETSTTR
jgi:glycosyltransferase involved in cell wall biosynthesis